MPPQQTRLPLLRVLLVLVLVTTLLLLPPPLLLPLLLLLSVCVGLLGQVRGGRLHPRQRPALQ